MPADTHAVPGLRGRTFAVALAGGTSRRFGSDKLSTDVGGRSLLDRALDDIPPDWPLIIVGPPRPTDRPATFVREEPAGGGPGAALVHAARHCLNSGADAMVTLAGDAPFGGRAALLLAEHAQGSGASAVVATDAAGRDQPLQLFVRDEPLRALAGCAQPAGIRARALLDLLTPLARLALPAELTSDIDTPDHYQAWLTRFQSNR